MRFTKLFSRRRGAVYTDADTVAATRESSPDVHQLKSTRRRNGAARRPSRRDGAFTDMVPTPTSSRVVADEEHQPCVICRAVDFPSLLDWRPGQPRPWVELSHTITQSWISVAPAKPGDTDSLTASSTSVAEEVPCPYCTFFRMMIGRLPDESGKFTPYLRIRQAFEKLGVKEKSELGKAVVVEVTTKDKELPWGYILKAADDSTEHEGPTSVKSYLGRKQTLEGRVVPEMLDPLLPRTWMDFCREHHGDACEIVFKSEIPGLKLVDCESLRVVLATDIAQDTKDKYAALSYVWSGNDEDLDVVVRDDGRIDGRLPVLFADAVTITKNLGLRYLWIDKCCLLQDAVTLAHSSSLVGDIFHQAAVALIPATDDTTGIPGVSVPREEQLTLKTDAGLFTTSLLSPDLEVAGCRWATEAQTFQEGLLSRRRLVFTPSQCYFQCQSLHCHESIGVSLHLAPSLTNGRVFAADAGGSTPAQLKDQIKAYIPREAASDEEKLRAFDGVLRRYRQMDKSVDELLGIPVFHPTEFNSEGFVSRTDRLAVGLGWMTTSESPAPASKEPYFYHQDDNDAGKGLPSWTWLSWRIRPGFESVNQAFHFSMVNSTLPLITPNVTAPPMMETSVGFEDGKIMSWEIDGDTAVRRKRATKTGRIAFLRVTTWCFDMQVKEPQQQQQQQQTSAKPWEEEEPQTLECNLPKNARERVLGWWRDAVPAPSKGESTPIADALSSKPLPDPNDSGPITAKDEPKPRLVGLLLNGRGFKDPTASTTPSSPTQPQASQTSTATSSSINSSTIAHSSHPAAFTILVCITTPNGADGGEDGTQLRRLGALHVPCDGFAAVNDKDAILRGVEMEVGEKKALKLDLREVDLW